MEILPVFILLALLTGAAGLFAFYWALKGGQFEDINEASARMFRRDNKKG